MDTKPEWSRRALLSTSVLGGLGTLTGCLGSGRDLAAVTGSGGATASETETQTAGEQCLTDFLAAANGYDGHTKQYRPDASPTVVVRAGREATDAHDSFEPVVARVVPDTTVSWRWLGYGGEHNVVALDGTFDSGEPEETRETPFQYTFTEPGTYQYVSEPNRENGMRGVIEVAEPPSGAYPTVDEWLAGVEGYDGTIPDHREYSTVTITVGSAAGPDRFDFAPPAVKISPDTTVTWVWSGDGAPHNVAFRERDIRFDSIETRPGVHFEHTFTEPGVYRYACEPHNSIGQRGAVVVEASTEG